MLLCCLCAVTSQLPGDNGYSGGKVIFVDTENTLYPQDDADRLTDQLEQCMWLFHTIIFQQKFRTKKV